ncbi:hypothetical protein DPMN_009859 [Dreissena polymorpha]|uniref:Caprin-1 dimerization domain-containing protein n=1 Tax=Dreissena polymorpha TaxID=45954 RepID=A0A9D4N0E9_DREPO|nr:hypothetical protein DPMN_009859 [Dreissena polymorpha]
MYPQFVDHLMSELETRLMASESRYIAQHLLPKKAVDIIHEVAEKIFQAYQEELSVMRDEFQSEIRRWRTKWTRQGNPKADLQETLISMNEHIYPGIFAILNVAWMPVSTATAERSFSTTRRPTDPFKRVLNVVDKKVRNLEKRKVKLDAYRQKQDSGATLEKDQLVAVEKYGEVVTNLEFARDLQKQFSSINSDAEKLLKKQAKRGKSEKQMQELKRIREVLQLQGLLDSMGTDVVRQDFKTGKHGAIVLTEENLEQIDELYKLVSPVRGGDTDYLESLSEASEHIVNLLDAKDKPIGGSTYKTLKELLDLISQCGYFEHVSQEEGEKEDFELVQHEDVPAPDSEEVQSSLPPDVSEEEEEELEMQPSKVVMTTAEADAFFHTPVPAHAVNQQEVAAVFSQQQQQQARRPFQEIVSSVQGNFNFLQESTIEMEAKHREFSPHMDPAVVAAHPMPTTGYKPSYSEQSAYSDQIITSSAVEQSVYSQAQHAQKTFTNSGYALQSDNLFAGSDSGLLGNKVTSESGTLSHTKYDIPPQLPMPPGHEQSSQESSSDLDKKSFQMNPNATEFQLGYSQQGDDDLEESNNTSDDGFQGVTYTNTGFSRDQRRDGGGRGGFRGGRGGNRGNMSNGYSRGGRGNYQGYQQRSDYNRGGSEGHRGGSEGYPSYNNGSSGSYNNGGGFQKRGGEGGRGGGPRGGSRGGGPRGGGFNRGMGSARGTGRGGTQGFGRPNFNQQQP